MVCSSHSHVTICSALLTLDHDPRRDDDFGGRPGMRPTMSGMIFLSVGRGNRLGSVLLRWRSRAVAGLNRMLVLDLAMIAGRISAWSNILAAEARSGLIPKRGQSQTIGMSLPPSLEAVWS